MASDGGACCRCWRRSDPTSRRRRSAKALETAEPADRALVVGALAKMGAAGAREAIRVYGDESQTAEARARCGAGARAWCARERAAVDALVGGAGKGAPAVRVATMQSLSRVYDDGGRRRSSARSSTADDDDARGRSGARHRLCRRSASARGRRRRRRSRRRGRMPAPARTTSRCGCGSCARWATSATPSSPVRSPRRRAIASRRCARRR